jgi:hypothetical protein
MPTRFATINRVQIVEKHNLPAFSANLNRVIYLDRQTVKATLIAPHAAISITKSTSCQYLV